MIKGQLYGCRDKDKSLIDGGDYMDIVPYVDDMEKYLKADYVIDYGNKAIAQIADTLFQEAKDELEFIKKAYELVRDHISHSADINEDILTCSASEVLSAGHGICFAKSHLLAAILRCKSVPAGFCYQKLILDDFINRQYNGLYTKLWQKFHHLKPSLHTCPPTWRKIICYYKNLFHGYKLIYKYSLFIGLVPNKYMVKVIKKVETSTSDVSTRL